MFYVLVFVAFLIAYNLAATQENRIRQLEDEAYDKEHEHDYDENYEG